ncbi:MAG: DNA-directed RNA polymerase subunit beta', partial [Xanthobacteraceae bacterium]|nr:DNA-directed RNA polymerase subunit beta' [Xanthobacteraceae bacterium]
LMMSTNNILHPANGSPIIVPSQDIVLGLYYLSLMRDKEPGEGMMFGNIGEIEHALSSGAVSLHAKIKGRYIGVDDKGNKVSKIYETTPGRLMLGEVLPKHPRVPFDVVNKLMTKREISGMIDQVYRHCGQKETVIFCDRIMALGFHHAFKAGISFGKDDMVVPTKKWEIVDQTRGFVKEFEQEYNDGLTTEGEKYNKVVDAWDKCTKKIAEEMMKEISSVKKDSNGREKPINSIYMMSHSGARGSPEQMKQLAGMRGPMAKPSGEIIESPIISNFKEGLSVLEYFNSTHGARKGLADTALKTANSGYLTRRLVDVAQDCIVTEEDCGTKAGIKMRSIVDAGTIVASLASRILGRTTLEDINDPATGKPIVKKGVLLDEALVDQIAKAKVQEVRIRSPLTCETVTGICRKCYGRDLARGTPVNLGEAVGVIAAQSIGEPGTQLTMRTFHIGGAAQIADQSFIESNFEGTVKIKNREIAKNSDGDTIVMNRSLAVIVVDQDGTERATHRVPFGGRLKVDEGQKIIRGQRIAEWDPYTRPILTEVDGHVAFEDLVEGQSLSESVDEATGIAKRMVIDWRGSVRKNEELRPAIVIKGSEGALAKLKLRRSGAEARYTLPVDAILSVDPGEAVKAGDVLARVPTEGAKTRDITGGLPRVAELFEARSPKDVGTLAEITGTVSFGKETKGKVRLQITDPDGKVYEELVP